MGERIRRAGIETRFGPLLCAATEAGVCLVVLEAERRPEALARWVDRYAPGATVVEDPQFLADAGAQLAAYGEGRLRDFDLPLDPRGSDFELAVWRALAAIPYGRTRTYGELAAALGRRGAARAVGRAAGRNPLPVLIPCHRLLARGGLGGFSGGLDLKRRLLSIEGVAVQAEFS